MTPSRIFLLSPASCGGERARLVFNERAQFDVAVRLRSPEGIAIGDVFSFLSGLYFRGKLEYARAFAAPPAGAPGVLVITPSEGLLPAHEPVTLARLRRFARVPIDASEARYRRPLARHARSLAAVVGPDCEVVLLGSIATGKYVDILEKAFGDRLRFPGEFVGRGDMSRGGLLLRCVREGRQLGYRPIGEGARHGKRPPKLERLRARRETELASEIPPD
ncbi:MAG: hypothetical protein LC796_07430 [Acidobacteria bacterium]|nr:hypothetical protein [Acidobacteriota bacterium]